MPTERNGKAQPLTFALPLEAHAVIQRVSGWLSACRSNHSPVSAGTELCLSPAGTLSLWLPTGTQPWKELSSYVGRVCTKSITLLDTDPALVKFGSILSSSRTFQTRVRFLRRGRVPKGTLLLHVGKHQEMMSVWYAKGERPGTRAEATRLLHSHSQPSFIHFFHYSELWNSLCWPSNLYIPPGQVLSHSRFLYRSVCGRGLLLEE